MSPLLAVGVPITTLAGYGLAVLFLLGLPVLAIAGLVLLVRRQQAPPGAGAGSANVGPLPLTHAPVDWGVFSGLFTAIAANNRQLLLDELAFLSRLVRNKGSVEAVIEDFLFEYLDKRLADPSKKTPILTKLADTLGTDVPTLVAAIEGKTIAKPAAFQGSLMQTLAAPLEAVGTAAAVKTAVLAIGVFAALAGEARAVSPLTKPQRFYPAEVEPVIDPPQFASAVRGDVLQPQAGEMALAPSRWQQPAACAPSSARRRWFFRCR